MTLELVLDSAPMPERGADAWAVRLDRGDLSAAEVDAFHAWFNEPGNRDAYADSAAALYALDGLDPLFPELSALRSEALRDEAGDIAIRQSVKHRRWVAWAGGALAASIAAALLLVGQPALREGETGNVPQPSLTSGAAIAYRTGVGEQRAVKLPDGTSITLNTATEIAVDYRAGERLVRLLQGQALFDVAHAPDRPFSVVADGRRVTALGTTFEVRLDKERLQVTLTEGKLRVDALKANSADAKPPTLAVLAPGQKLLMAGTAAPVVESVDIDKQLLWIRSLIEFDGESIGSAVAEINRYSTTRVVVRDARVAAMRMSGTVRTGNAREFIALVSAILPITSRENSRGEIELYAR